MTTIHVTAAAISFLLGWCGTVPISVWLWWILHHRPIPGPPPPDPWYKISLSGAITGLVLGTATYTLSFRDGSQISTLLLCGAISLAAGTVVGSIIAKSSLSEIQKTNTH